MQRIDACTDIGSPNDNGRRQPSRMMTMAGSQRPGLAPRVALLGEFSAGKSSIVNLLLGQDVLPTAVLSNTSRPTYVHHAPDLRIEAVSEAGERELVSFDVVTSPVRNDIGYFDIGMPIELLRDLELLDTPGFADPFRDPARTLDVIESADVCVWCTLATQSWRQSERQIWLRLPERARMNGILVVTHTDNLARQGDHMRVLARLEHEVGDLFADIVLLAVPDAMRAVQADGRIADAELWRQSGGSALVAALQKAVINYHKARGKNVSFDKAAETLWRRIEFTQADSDASPSAMRAAVPALGTLDRPPESPIAVELQRRLLATVMETVPGCVATAWIDLAGRRVLQLRGPDADEIAGTTALGKAIADLFQGSKVQRIERLFKHSRGLAEDGRHYFREIFVTTDDCVGLFLRDQSRADRCLVVVSDRAVNLGMVLARTRDLMASTDFSI